MIVVTAPTGQIGRATLENLLASDQEVRVIVRDRDRLTTEIAARCDTVEGSHEDPDVVDRAFRGADAVLWNVPAVNNVPDSTTFSRDFSAAAAGAAERHGVNHMVTVSMLGRSLPSDAGLATAAFAMDDLLASVVPNYRSLALPSFIDNLRWHVQSLAAEGVFRQPISGDIRMPTCATQDVGPVAADLLLARSWTGRADVPVLGPEDLSYNDMAKILTEVLERPVAFEQIDHARYQSHLSQVGMSDSMCDGMLKLYLAKEAGLDDSTRMRPEFSSPTSFHDWCSNHLKPLVEEAS